MTGTNIIEAIILALREKLGRIESLQERLGDLREIAKDFAALTKDVPRIDHAELRYDELRLPK